MQNRLVFLDTEFTNWSTPRLISIGLVDLSGERIFYAELTDTYTASHCSPFVRENVLPLLSGGKSQMTTRECREALAAWFTGFEEQIEIVSDDLEYDFYLLRELLGDHWPTNLLPEGFQFMPKNYPKIEKRLTEARAHFYSDLPGRHEHHALDDARALRACWLEATSRREGGSIRDRAMPPATGPNIVEQESVHVFLRYSDMLYEKYRALSELAVSKFDTDIDEIGMPFGITTDWATTLRIINACLPGPARLIRPANHVAIIQGDEENLVFAGPRNGIMRRIT
jgi:hypothetical protein